MKTINLLVFEMVRIGKNTLVLKLEEEIANKDIESYIINLHSAVMDTLYEPNLDIRDPVNYKEIIISNNLKLSSVILICLNIFSINIDKAYHS